MKKIFLLTLVGVTFSFASGPKIKTHVEFDKEVLEFVDSTCSNLFIEENSNYLNLFSKELQIPFNFNKSIYKSNLKASLVLKKLGTKEKVFSKAELAKLNSLVSSKEFKSFCDFQNKRWKKEVEQNNINVEKLKKIVSLTPYDMYVNDLENIYIPYLYKNNLKVSKPTISKFSNNVLGSVLFDLNSYLSNLSDNEKKEFIDFLKANKESISLFKKLFLMSI